MAVTCHMQARATSVCCSCRHLVCNLRHALYGQDGACLLGAMPTAAASRGVNSVEACTSGQHS